MDCGAAQGSRHHLKQEDGGQSWIRTSVGVSQQIYRMYNSLIINVLHTCRCLIFPGFSISGYLYGSMFEQQQEGNLSPFVTKHQ
jgi:hypothetical protein